MATLIYTDDLLQRVFERTRVIAMVGASPNAARPSHAVGAYLISRGYQVIPVNPAAAGERIWNQTVYPDLASIPGPVHMVDVFRASDAAGGIVDEAIALKDEKGIETIWMQLGVIDMAAADRAEAAGLTVIMDRCPKIELPRLTMIGIQITGTS